MQKKLLVMGGDRRMEYAAATLAADFDVSTYGFAESPPVWEIGQADILVLPYLSLRGDYLNTPTLSQKIPAVASLDMLRYGGVVFGGGLPPKFLSYCSDRAARVFDFFDDEELTLRNALLTAEGALEILLRETDCAVNGSEVLIFGFGRVGKACASVLASLGAEVTVSARSEKARADAAAIGYKTAKIGDLNALCAADAVINTVPQRIIAKAEISAMKKEAMILDLASAPYGVDFEAARELGIRATTAPGLPGKTAPKTAGELIARSVAAKMKEVAENGQP